MILSIALDPRFRKLAFLKCEQRDEVYNILVDQGSTYCPSISLDQPLFKKSSLLGSLLGEDEEEDKSTITDEVSTISKNVLLNGLTTHLGCGGITLYDTLD